MSTKHEANLIEDLVYARRTYRIHLAKLESEINRRSITDIETRAGYVLRWEENLDSTMNAVDRYMDVDEDFADAAMAIRQGHHDAFLDTNPTTEQMIHFVGVAR